MPKSLRIQYFSDIHSEKGTANFLFPEDFGTDADIVIIAGDIGCGVQSINLIEKLFPRGQQVAFVPGNHEFMHTAMSIDETVAAMKNRAHEINNNSGDTWLHVLSDDQVTLNIKGASVSILGSTLWTDCGLYGDVTFSAAMMQRYLGDYHKILSKDRKSALKPDETIARHRASKNFLERSLRSAYASKTIVVSHHLPTFQSVVDEFKEDILTAGYASHADAIMMNLPIDLWVHGHSHTSLDYRHDSSGTRIVCNASGFLDGDGRSENGLFDPQLVIEI